MVQSRVLRPDPGGSQDGRRGWLLGIRDPLRHQPYNGDPRLFDNPNAANYNAIVFQPGTKLDPVGSFTDSLSYYGTQDQAGSLWEWSDTYVENYLNQPNSMIVRSGSWSLGILNPGSDVRRDYTPDETDDDTGFRIAGSQSTVTYSASPAGDVAVAAPEPPTPSTAVPTGTGRQHPRCRTSADDSGRQSGIRPIRRPNAALSQLNSASGNTKPPSASTSTS